MSEHTLKEHKISKAEFKTIYFQHSTRDSGWTSTYWDQFFENEKEGEYYLVESQSAGSARMFIRSEGQKHCIYFLTEDAEESFFDFPGKE